MVCAKYVPRIDKIPTLSTEIAEQRYPQYGKVGYDNFFGHGLVNAFGAFSQEYTRGNSARSWDSQLRFLSEVI